MTQAVSKVRLFALWVAVLIVPALQPLVFAAATGAASKSKGRVEEKPQKAQAPEEAGPPPDPIKWGGLWLSGKLSDMERDFPVGKDYTSRMVEGEGGSWELSREMLKTLRSKAKPGGKRLVDALAPDDYMPEAKAGKALVLACVVTYEGVELLNHGGSSGSNELEARLDFNLVLCDFSNRSVVAAIPGRLAGRHAPGGTKAITKEQQVNALRQLYWRTDKKQASQDRDLLERFTDLAGELGPELAGLGRAGVTKVTVFDEARKVIPSHLREIEEHFFSRLAGCNFYDGAKLPLIPFSRGNELVFCAMQEKLSDASEQAIKSNEAGDGVRFTLQKPEYEIELVIPAFRTVTVSSAKNIGKVVQDCCYSRITIKHGDQTIYTAQHDANAQRILASGSPESGYWGSYYSALNLMFFEGAKQIKAKLAAQRKKQENPLLVIEPAALREMFIDCAPWSIVGK